MEMVLIQTPHFSDSVTHCFFNRILLSLQVFVFLAVFFLVDDFQSHTIVLENILDVILILNLLKFILWLSM